MADYQWLRKVKLAVGDDTGSGLDLSDLHIVFRVQTATISTPKLLEVRIFNLWEGDAQTIQQEFTQVQLSAGYQDGPFGKIFSGSISRIRIGRENATDTFLEIVACDGDEAYCWGTVQQALAAGHTLTDELNLIKAQLEPYQITIGYIPELQNDKGKGIRGKVVYKSLRDFISNFAAEITCDWHIEDGQLSFIPQAGYVPGDAVVLNGQSGILGSPVQTIDGLEARCLLNPNLRPGRLIQVNNKEVQTETIRPTPISVSDQLYIPDLSKDGTYKVYALSHIGDTRGQAWFSELICEAMNPTSGNVVTSSRYLEAVPQ